MKKVILSAVAASFLLASCGPDLCECVNQKKDEMSDDCKKLSEDWEKKYKDASDEEKEKMMKEIKSCLKDEKKEEE